MVLYLFVVKNVFSLCARTKKKPPKAIINQCISPSLSIPLLLLCDYTFCAKNRSRHPSGSYVELNSSIKPLTIPLTYCYLVKFIPYLNVSGRFQLEISHTYLLLRTYIYIFITLKHHLIHHKTALIVGSVLQEYMLVTIGPNHRIQSKALRQGLYS